MEDSGALERPTQDEMGTDISSLFRGAVRLVIKNVRQEEVRELVGARRYQRLRVGRTIGTERTFDGS